MLRRTGFTLIELLVVCGILAAIAYAGVSAYAGVDRRAEDELARVALMRLAAALGRFHGDTGYWPGEGPFRLAGATCDTAAKMQGGSGMIKLGSPPVTNAWFESPANFSLLFEPPSPCTNHPLAFLKEWDPSSHRGWNGPYLPLADRHWADVRLRSDGLPGGDVAKNVPAFGIGPAFPPDGTVTGWRSLPDTASGYSDATHRFVRHARPFVFLADPRPRVVYWGPDGRFGGANDSAPCLPNASDPDGKDDVVICL